jgi:hypothetical protein
MLGISGGGDLRTHPTNTSRSKGQTPQRQTSTMVVLTPHFASLLVFVVSGSMIMSGVDALPHPPQVSVDAI